MKNVTSEELERLKSHGEKLLVGFYAEWCGPCKMLIPRLERLESEYPDVKFVRVNVDQNGSYTMDMGIRSIPTIIFFDGSSFKGQLTGVLPDDIYKKYLSQLTEQNA